MDPLLLLPLAVGPGVVWMLWFFRKDRYEPEPPIAILRIFLLGAMVVIPAAFGELLVSYVAPAILLPVLLGPLIEEFAKYQVVRRYIYDDPEFDEPMDGIVYAVAAALGFATLENVLYVGSAAIESVPLALGVSAIRAFLSVPGHALMSLCWGAALGRARFMEPGQGRLLVAVGFALAVALHGVFNYLVSDTITMVVLVFLLVPIAWIAASRTIEGALRDGYRP